MNISSIDHICIAVKELQSAGEFFKNCFGLKISHVEEVPEQGVKVASIEIDSITIELIQPLDKSSNLNKFLDKHGPGPHHIAFKVDDIEKSLEELKNSGVKLIDEIPRTGAHGKKIAFVRPSKSTGTLIELCEE